LDKALHAHFICSVDNDAVLKLLLRLRMMNLILPMLLKLLLRQRMQPRWQKKMYTDQSPRLFTSSCAHRSLLARGKFLTNRMHNSLRSVTGVVRQTICRLFAGLKKLHTCNDCKCTGHLELAYLKKALRSDAQLVKCILYWREINSLKRQRKAAAVENS